MFVYLLSSRQCTEPIVNDDVNSLTSVVTDAAGPYTKLVKKNVFESEMRRDFEAKILFQL